MHRHGGEIVVVQSGAAELRVAEIEGERLDKVQVCAGRSGGPDRIARVGRDPRFDEHEVEHGYRVIRIAAAARRATSITLNAGLTTTVLTSSSVLPRLTAHAQSRPRSRE